jgi:hypothetical protein
MVKYRPTKRGTSEAINSNSLQHSQHLNVDFHHSNLNVDYDDTYLLFRDNYLSNVVNSRAETSRPLHLYKLKVQCTTKVGMLDSDTQINCVSQHICPVYFYDIPFKLGMAVESDKYEVTS